MTVFSLRTKQLELNNGIRHVLLKICIKMCCHVNILAVEFFKFCTGWNIMQKVHVFGFRITAVWTSPLC